MSSQPNDPEQMKRAHLEALQQLRRDEDQKNIYKQAIIEARKEQEAEQLAQKRRTFFQATSLTFLIFGLIAALFMGVCLILVLGGIWFFQPTH